MILKMICPNDNNPLNISPNPVPPQPIPPIPQLVTSVPNITQPNGVRYAGFWIRLLALILDVVFLNIISFGLGILFRIVNLNNVNMIDSVLVASYYVGFLGAVGATPGKMIVGIKVVRSNGQSISYMIAILREFIGKLVSVLILGIGFLWVAWDPKKQGLHDKIAGTIVIYTK